MLRKFLPLIISLSLFGCKNGNSFSAIPSTPPLKPTPECLQAKSEINDLLKSNPDFLGAFETFLTDETCALMIVTDLSQNRLPIAQKLKATFGAETSVSLGNARIPLWFFEPATTWIPVLDPDTMKPLDPQETFEECQQAAQWLKQSFPQAAAAPQKYPRHQSDPFCYVDLAFDTEPEFEDFLSWSNPYSLDGSLFFIHFQRATGVIATVAIYAHEALDFP